MHSFKLWVLVLIVNSIDASIFSSISKLIYNEKTCEKPRWCSLLLEKCSEPLINQVTCCYFCPIEATKTTTTTTSTSTTTTTPKPTGGRITEILGSGSNTNEIIVVKTVKERISQECLKFSKNVGYPGCDIIETCKSDADCLVFQKCCLQNCVRKCV